MCFLLGKLFDRGFQYLGSLTRKKARNDKFITLGHLA